MSRPSKLACIGVLTSGGDSQGMNCVLFGLLAGSLNQTDVYLIRDGYQGLVTGGPTLIEKGNHETMAKFLHQVLMVEVEDALIPMTFVGYRVAPSSDHHDARNFELPKDARKPLKICSNETYPTWSWLVAMAV